MSFFIPIEFEEVECGMCKEIFAKVYEDDACPFCKKKGLITIKILSTK